MGDLTHQQPIQSSESIGRFATGMMDSTNTSAHGVFVNFYSFLTII